MMAEAPASPSGTAAAAAPPAARVRSVDVLRAAVIAAMVVVNNVSGAPRVPGWTQHLPGEVDGYTVADMVLPWFLFLVGVSLPLSLRRYLDGRRLAAAGRVLPRAAGLLLLGVILVNTERLDAKAAGFSSGLWLTLALPAAVALLWAPRPETSRRLIWAVKLGAVVVLLALLVMYRGDRAQGGSAWLVPSWWGILGIIGWAYLVAAGAYLAVRGDRAALLGLVGLAVAIAIGSARGRPGLLGVFDPLFSVHDFFGSNAAIVLAGAVAGGLLMEVEPGLGRRLIRLGVLGLGLWAAGWLLRPLHGYHKLGATESWALVAAGQGTLLLALAHLTFDEGPVARVLGGTPPVTWLALAGQNALLAYLLAEWIHPASGIIGWDLTPGYTRGGWVAMGNAALVTVAVLAVAAVASHRRFTVKL